MIIECQSFKFRKLDDLFVEQQPFIVQQLSCTEIIEKNNIYEYLLKVIVGDDGFKKMKTEVYDKVGWGLYFSINKI